ncbi:RNA-binding S1 domain protein [Alteracholeplasma palmae J233]|uniref:RNA-binding S1 domain protein n=1 Tax=Alteracholeplasma palmae (strain ATCC 49389 / J233) TaxID=1318466 RepID=U4KJT3_ALTPJ|nr:S1 RNA-binding domain-containing protein [Alteracholeplasma palmae]CCV63693.1 RNA-binding S1 domain protein [Alteracholeplasma palmae J233]
MKEKTKVCCTVTGIQNYGVFVSCGEYQGLIHISEISDKYVANINSLFEIGESIQACILESDEINKKLTLSYKKAHIINPKVLNQVDIKIGFKSLENKLPEWIEDKKEKK